jgi:hypothetical protein
MDDVVLRCACGSRLDLEHVHPTDREFLRATWARLHSGPEHRPIAAAEQPGPGEDEQLRAFATAPAGKS